MLNEQSVNEWKTTSLGELCIKQIDEDKQIHFEGYDKEKIRFLQVIQ